MLLPQQLDQNDLMRLGCSAGGKIGEIYMKYIVFQWYYPKPEVFGTNPMFLGYSWKTRCLCSNPIILKGSGCKGIYIYSSMKSIDICLTNIQSTIFHFTYD